MELKGFRDVLCGGGGWGAVPGGVPAGDERVSVG